MKIAYAILLVFVLLTGYLTLREHTVAVGRLHQDNKMVILTLESIDHRLETINKTMATAPLPIPTNERLTSEPKVATSPAPVNDQTPVRKPEIINE